MRTSNFSETEKRTLRLMYKQLHDVLKAVIEDRHEYDPETIRAHQREFEVFVKLCHEAGVDIWK